MHVVEVKSLQLLMDDVLREIYYDPSHPAGYSGLEPVYKAAKKKLPTLKRNQVQLWLKKQDTYTLHKPSRRKYNRNRVTVFGIDEQWQADLVDVSSISRYNKGIKFLLTCIDVFSKSAWVYPLKDKSGTSLFIAFRKLFKDSGRIPQKLQTDKGTEFYNRKVQALLKDKGIKLFSTENETKASVVERFNRTLKSRMWKYFTAKNTNSYLNVLSSFVKAYNSSYHRSIKRAPREVGPRNELEVWHTLYPEQSKDKPKLKVGAVVRLSMETRPFKKGYLPRWTEELFVVQSHIKRTPIVYRIADLDGEEVKGTFYAEELQEIGKKEEDALYKIERIVRSRLGKDGKKEYLIKWYGYPSKFNTWETDIVKM